MTDVSLLKGELQELAKKSALTYIEAGRNFEFSSWVSELGALARVHIKLSLDGTWRFVDD